MKQMILRSPSDPTEKRQPGVSEERLAPSADVAVATVPPSEARTQPTRLLRDIIETMLLTAIVFLLVNTLIGRFRIEQVSMLPNLHEGEYVIVDKISYWLHQPQRGDIIVLKRAGQPDLIKRVVGLPGETIEVRDGKVYVNGTPLSEPYTAQPPAYVMPARQIDADQYFVLGDNRNNSSDSHAWGTVPGADIIGRAMAIYWPPPDWQLLSRPTYAAAESQ